MSFYTRNKNDILVESPDITHRKNLFVKLKKKKTLYMLVIT